MNYYQFHIGDYISHTRNLSLMEDLAYRRLLDECYLHEKPLDTGIEALARKIGMREHSVEVEFVLKVFFKLTDEGWVNTRAMQEIQKYQEYSAAGKRGAAKRWGGNSPPNAAPIATINHKPLTNKKTIYATPDGVSDFVWQDFVILRKAKKLPITDTVIKGLLREGQKANLTLEQTLQICCERGWAGFKAEWIQTKVGNDKSLAAARSIFGDERNQHERHIIDI